MLHLLLQRERDLKDTSLPQVVVELALLTAAQLPHLAPLDAMLKGAPAAASPPRPESGTAARAADPQTPQPGSLTRRPEPVAPSPQAPPAPAVSTFVESTLQPLADPTNLEHLRKACAEALKVVPGGLPRTLAVLPHMATELRLEGHTLHWFFPPNVWNTVHDLEREQANPHLLESLRQVLPGLAKIVITFDAEAHVRPEDALRSDPVFQRLLQETGGEVVEVRRE
jgi:DNA polymerase-3 subunit gamma/tau